MALRMRVNISAIGSVSMFGHVLSTCDCPVLPTRLRTPGIKPWSANLRKQIRQMPNLRYTARGRPHSLHRRLSRVENFGVSFAFAIFDLLATSSLSSTLNRHCVVESSLALHRLAILLFLGRLDFFGLERHAHLRQQLARFVVAWRSGSRT